MLPEGKDALWPVVQENEWWQYGLKDLSLLGELENDMASALMRRKQVQKWYNFISNTVCQSLLQGKRPAFNFKLYEYFKIKGGPSGPPFIF